MDDVTVRFAGEDELGSLVELWTSVFNVPALDFTCEYESYPPEHRLTIVGEVDGRLVSSVQLFGLPLRDENLKRVVIGAIANVCTLPEYRSHGIAIRLLKKAIGEMRERGYAWSFLFTGRHSFYEQIGWRTIHRSFLEVNVRGLHFHEASNPLRYFADPDLARLRALHEGSFKTPLSRIRGDLDWRVRIPARIVSKAVFMGDTTYAIVREDGSNAILEEWGMPSPSIEEFSNILVAVSGWAQERDLHDLIVTAPIFAEARQALESHFSRIRNIDETEAMIRPLNEEWTIARLISLFSLPEARFVRLDNF